MNSAPRPKRSSFAASARAFASRVDTARAPVSRDFRGVVMPGYTSAADSAQAAMMRIGGATIVVYAITPADSSSGQPESRREVARTVSADDGTFSMAPLAPGRYLVRVTPPAGSAYHEAERFLNVAAAGPPPFLWIMLPR